MHLNPKKVIAFIYFIINIYLFRYFNMVFTRRMTRNLNRQIHAVTNHLMQHQNTDQPYRQARRNTRLNAFHHSTSQQRSNQPNSSVSGKPPKDGMHIGTLNVIDGRGSILQLACRQLILKKLDIAVLTEVKLNGTHTSKRDGCEIQATRCTNQHQGWAEITTRQSRFWNL